LIVENHVQQGTVDFNLAVVINKALIFFSTMAAASRAGKGALKQLLDKLESQRRRRPRGVTGAFTVSRVKRSDSVLCAPQHL
jgi:hypothetical protein